MTGRALWLGSLSVLAVFSYLAGASGSFRPATSTTELARLGFVLEQQSLQGSSDDWAALRKDLSVLRPMVKGDEQKSFDLVVAVRGLLNRGQPNWKQAARLCEELKWKRCDRQALEAIERRTHP
jgi:hypothetical protein